MKRLLLVISLTLLTLQLFGIAPLVFETNTSIVTIDIKSLEKFLETSEQLSLQLSNILPLLESVYKLKILYSKGKQIIEETKPVYVINRITKNVILIPAKPDIWNTQVFWNTLKEIVTNLYEVDIKSLNVKDLGNNLFGIESSSENRTKSLLFVKQKGDYIVFVDSRTVLDWYESNATEIYDENFKKALYLFKQEDIGISLFSPEIASEEPEPFYTTFDVVEESEKVTYRIAIGIKTETPEGKTIGIRLIGLPTSKKAKDILLSWPLKKGRTELFKYIPSKTDVAFIFNITYLKDAFYPFLVPVEPDEYLIPSGFLYSYKAKAKNPPLLIALKMKPNKEKKLMKELKDQGFVNQTKIGGQTFLFTESSKEEIMYIGVYKDLLIVANDKGIIGDFISSVNKGDSSFYDNLPVEVKNEMQGIPDLLFVVNSVDALVDILNATKAVGEIPENVKKIQMEAYLVGNIRESDSIAVGKVFLRFK